MTILDVFLWGGVAFAVLVSAMLLARRFDRHCMLRFRHAFFTRKNFAGTLVIVALWMVGQYWHESALRHHGSMPGGALVLMALAALAFCALLRANVRRTNLPYGVGGTVAQVSIMLIPAAVLLSAAMIVAFFIALMYLAAFMPRR